jgi:hypothetical protein
MNYAERTPLLVLSVVRVRQCFKHLSGDKERDIQRETAPLGSYISKESGTGGAFDILHSHEKFATVFTEIEHSDDVWVMKRRTNSRFIAKHGDKPGVLRQLRQYSLDGVSRLCASFYILPDPDLGHSAAT